MVPELNNLSEMNIPLVDLNAQYKSVKSEIDEAIQLVIDSTAFIKGEGVHLFENEFAAKFGVKHCIGVANGTDALYIALKMLGIGPGDEVITAANSWVSTAEAIIQTGAKPVFVDIDDYYTIDCNKIEEKITENTIALLPVHLFGQAAEMKRLSEIAAFHNLYLIEDCAQSHLSSINGQNTGTFGDVATFSFYPSKNLGAYGDAGAVVTNDDDLAKNIRMFANHGALIKHQHLMAGINSRLDALQTAILRVKLPHLEHWNETRRKNAKLYENLLDDVGDIICPTVRPNSVHNFHVYCIRTSHRDSLMKHLKDSGIETAVHYPLALPFLPAFSQLNQKETDFPVAAKFQHQILSLPMYPELETGKISYITDKIREFFKYMKHP